VKPHGGDLDAERVNGMERLGGHLVAVSGVGTSVATSTWSLKAALAQCGVLGGVGSV
jgi:hypothetical protein